MANDILTALRQIVGPTPIATQARNIVSPPKLTQPKKPTAVCFWT